MILYNVTVNIDDSVHDQWIQWMVKEHIPEMMATGLFFENRFCKIKGHEEGGKSYSIQYLLENEEKYNTYLDEYATDLQAKHLEKFNGKFGAFRTILEVIHIMQTQPK